MSFQESYLSAQETAEGTSVHALPAGGLGLIPSTIHSTTWADPAPLDMTPKWRQRWVLYKE